MPSEPGRHGVVRPTSLGASRYTDLEVWKNASALRDQVNRLVMLPEFARHSWIQTELRRAAQAACTGIADGFDRGPRDFARFVQSARARLTEVRDLLVEATRLRLVTGARAAGIGALAEAALRSASSLLRDLEHAG